MNDENYLAHYGVQGMKWGVRNDYSNGALGRRVRAARAGLLVPKDSATNIKTTERNNTHSSYNNSVTHRVLAARRALSDSEVSDIIKRHLNDHI